MAPSHELRKNCVESHRNSYIIGELFASFFSSLIKRFFFLWLITVNLKELLIMTEPEESISSIAYNLAQKHGQNAELVAIQLMVECKKNGHLSEQKKWMQVADILSRERFLSDISNKPRD